METWINSVIIYVNDSVNRISEHSLHSGSKYISHILENTLRKALI